MIIYRILSFIVTVFCSLLAMITLFGIMMAFSNPAVLFQCFLMAGVVLYGWFANRFFAYVVIGKRQMSKKQKDWLQVNAIVAFIFSLMGVVSCIAIITNPDQLNELIKQIPSETEITIKTFLNISYGLLVICSLLLVHIVWTYLLLRNNKAGIES
ncbi:hypothetical protein FRZ67_21055 [Panacibacter ginsenosidivorans]|uniref:Uncharacterized protein n=1 Tax=Panacibacter ginsenosidivorans TaxID=1813871 RepID=A0A5B8VH77_9BACT|nr:hypothetical protein [Panacibacter ginsenosidivorans]QEC69668.1 hypothetical protein FRZ67_21055 [Panacibacter ginsenosidivorans]